MHAFIYSRAHMDFSGSPWKFRSEPLKARSKLALLGTLPIYYEELEIDWRMEKGSICDFKDSHPAILH